jgi:hypothetical protein
MELNKIYEVCWVFYQEGVVAATSQKLKEADIAQMVKMSYGVILRSRYYEAPPDERMDLIGGSLDIKKYDLGEPNNQGMRRALIPDEVVRMPKSSDVTNVYPISEGDCGDSSNWEVTQVSPAEENFYLTPDFNNFFFFVQKGKGINVYHLPPCIKSVEVERIYADKEMDIPLDMAFDIAISVLGVSLKIKEFVVTIDNSYDRNKNELRYQLEKQEAKK